MTIYSVSSKEPILHNKRVTKKVNQPKSFKLNEDLITEVHQNEGVNVLININPFLILNEIDNEEREKELLKETGGKLLKYLNEIRLGLLTKQLTPQHLSNLQDMLSKQTYEFQTPEIKRLVEEIKIRASVELAKLEYNLQ